MAIPTPDEFTQALVKEGIIPPETRYFEVRSEVGQAVVLELELLMDADRFKRFCELLVEHRDLLEVKPLRVDPAGGNAA